MSAKEPIEIIHDQLSPIVKEQLLNIMNEEKLFMDPEVNLYGLAEHIGISPHELSATINSGLGVNFFEFINMYRVEEVKGKIRHLEHRGTTLLGLGLESGFNSKASFNRTFKKFEGITPRDYVKLVEGQMIAGERNKHP